MRPVRFLLPLLLAFALLFAQQGAALHALGHVLTQQDKQTQHSPACEQCAAYAQLGGTLNSSTHSFVLDAAPNTAVRQRDSAFRPVHIFSAAARGPPALLQESA